MEDYLMQHLNALNLLKIVLITLFLTSCSSSPKQLITKVEAVKIERATYPRPTGLIVPKINLVVVTPDTMSDTPGVYFGFTEDNYLSFSQWLQDVLAHIKSQNAIIESYEKDVTDYNEQVKSD